MSRVRRSLVLLLLTMFLIALAPPGSAAPEHPAPDPSTLLGGSETDELTATDIGWDGRLYAAGFTWSSDFPQAPGNSGQADVFLARLSPDASTVEWARVIGGHDMDKVHAMTVARDGIYIAGETESPEFPVFGDAANDKTFEGATEGFLMKFALDGEPLWSTFVGGNSYDSVQDLELGPEGRPIIGGYTSSCDFRTTDGFAYREAPANCASPAPTDAFVARYWSHGALNRATLFGGSDNDRLYGLGVDPQSGEVTFTGRTRSDDLPTTSASYSQTPDDIYVAKLSAGLEELHYATYLGGAESLDWSWGLATDGEGDAYVTGYTYATDYPTTPGAYQTEHGSPTGCASSRTEFEAPCKDVFVTKLSADGSTLLYSTFLGGDNQDEGLAIVVDADGAAHVTGETASEDFLPDDSDPGFRDIFMAKLAPDGASLEALSGFGGSRSDYGNDLALASDGVWVGGSSYSDDYPTTPGAHDRTPDEQLEGVLSHLALETPPPDIRFDHRGGNEWWVEVDTTGAAVGAVQARDNADEWVDLTYRHWGNWAGSFHIEPGEPVQFRAMANGEWVLSCFFSHPDGVEQCPTEDDGFAVSFHNVRGDEWWIETDTTSADAIAGVDVIRDGGAPQPLHKTDWGSWAESYHAPEGTIVQFIATSTTGETDASDCYRWTGGERVACDDGSGGSDPGEDDGFAVTWHNVKGNEWWIETDTTADQTITGVDVTLDGGAAKPLHKTDWGTWAESYHAPEGTIVQFTATSSTGATNTSGCYRWTGAEPVACDGSGSGGDEATAPTFDHRTGNEWWVEVTVTDASPSRVQAMDTGGPWVELTKRDWGPWAASFHIEPGHDVRFRAQVDGTWYESCWFTHPEGTAASGGATCEGSAA